MNPKPPRGGGLQPDVAELNRPVQLHPVAAAVVGQVPVLGSLLGVTNAVSDAAAYNARAQADSANGWHGDARIHRAAAATILAGGAAGLAHVTGAGVAVRPAVQGLIGNVTKRKTE